MTPLEAIRLRCRWDCSEAAPDVANCPCSSPIPTPADTNGGYYCPLYRHRMGRKEPGAKTSLRAIHEYCLWCVDGQPREVKLCPVRDCPLYQYRQGKNPARAGLGFGAKKAPADEKCPVHGPESAQVGAIGD